MYESLGVSPGERAIAKIVYCTAKSTGVGSGHSAAGFDEIHLFRLLQCPPHCGILSNYNWGL